MITVALILLAACSAVLGACLYILWDEHRLRKRQTGKPSVQQGALWPDYMCKPEELRRLTARATARVHRSLRDKRK